jgi:hypothetical protein
MRFIFCKTVKAWIAALALTAAFAASAAAGDGLKQSPGSTDPVLRNTPLETDRLSPMTPAKNLPLQTEPGKTDYLLYTGIPSDRLNPILYLKIPHEFTGGAAEPEHNWGVHLIAWYPEMTGTFNPANKQRKDCPGWCKGKISLLIANWKDRGYTAAGTMLQHLYKDIARAKNSKEEKPLDIYTKKTISGFDEVYEAKFPYLGDDSTQLIYVKRSKDGKILFFAKCFPNARNPGCRAVLNIEEKYNTFVEYTFSMSLLNEWEKIDKSVRDLVSSFIVTTLLPAKAAP